MLHDAVKKSRSPLEGWGLFAVQPIPVNDRICWSAPGDVERLVTPGELRRLSEEEQHFAYRCREGYMLLSDDSQFMNHSCDPNTWWIDDDVMIARRDIAAGEELTYDYATSEVHPWWSPKWRCRCGAPDCRGIISGRDCLDRDFYSRHRGHLPSWVEDFRAQQRGPIGWAWAVTARVAAVWRWIRYRG